MNFRARSIKVPQAQRNSAPFKDRCKNMMDVGMDRCHKPVILKKNTVIGTSGLATCTAVCLLGKNNNGVTIASVGHYSSLDINKIDLQRAILLAGRGEYDVRSSGIETYIISNNISSNIKLYAKEIKEPDTIEWVNLGLRKNALSEEAGLVFLSLDAEEVPAVYYTICDETFSKPRNEKMAQEKLAALEFIEWLKENELLGRNTRSSNIFKELEEQLRKADGALSGEYVEWLIDNAEQKFRNVLEKMGSRLGAWMQFGNTASKAFEKYAKWLGKPATNKERYDNSSGGGKKTPEREMKLDACVVVKDTDEDGDKKMDSSQRSKPLEAKQLNLTETAPGHAGFFSPPRASIKRLREVRHVVASHFSSSLESNPGAAAIRTLSIAAPMDDIQEAAQDTENQPRVKRQRREARPSHSQTQEASTVAIQPSPLLSKGYGVRA